MTPAPAPGSDTYIWGCVVPVFLTTSRVHDNFLFFPPWVLVSRHMTTTHNEVETTTTRLIFS